MLDFRGRAVEFHQQQSAAVGIPGTYRGLSCLNRKVVHHLNRRRQHSCPNNLADRCPCFICGIERREQSLDHLGFLPNAQHDLCCNSERALRAHEDARQIISGTIDCPAAEMYERSIGKDYFERQDVRSRESVFQTVGAARVLRDVAADAAY